MFQICKKKYQVFISTVILVGFVFLHDMVIAGSPFGATVHKDVHGRKYIELIVDGVIEADSFNNAKAIIEGLRGQNIPIIVQINSPGGDVGGVMNILHTLRNWDAPVISVNNGIAYSAGAVLYITGDIRVARANSSTMFHGVQIQTSTVLNIVTTKELLDYIKEMNKDLYVLVSEESGQSEAQIRATWFDEYNENNFLSPRELTKFGILDLSFNEFFDRLSSQGLDSVIKSVRGNKGILNSLQIHFNHVLKTVDEGLDTFLSLLSSTWSEATQ